MAKERLDVLLVTKGLFQSREQAKKSIMAGLIKVNEEIMDKAGMQVPVDANIVIKGDLHPYVSRGGLKLLKAIKTFHIDLKGKVVIDIGASTGGFSDCSLQHGAKEIYAVDVGYGQLAWSLRQDERVHVLERTNFRYLTRENLKSSQPNFATIDVSFISLKIILTNLKNILEENGEVVALIKPQFEAGKELVGRKGIIKDPKVHQQVVTKVLTETLELDYNIEGLTFSPIKGGEGNVEFLMYLRNKKSGKTIVDFVEVISRTVESAHRGLQ